MAPHVARGPHARAVRQERLDARVVEAALAHLRDRCAERVGGPEALPHAGEEPAEERARLVHAPVAVLEVVAAVDRAVVREREPFPDEGVRVLEGGAPGARLPEVRGHDGTGLHRPGGEGPQRVLARGRHAARNRARLAPAREATRPQPPSWGPPRLSRHSAAKRASSPAGGPSRPRLAESLHIAAEEPRAPSTLPRAEAGPRADTVPRTRRIRSGETPHKAPRAPRADARKRGGRPSGRTAPPATHPSGNTSVRSHGLGVPSSPSRAPRGRAGPRRTLK